MPFNGPARELLGPQGEYLEESVYCTQCGSIFVSGGIGRSCPACTIAERQEEIIERIDALENPEVDA